MESNFYYLENALTEKLSPEAQQRLRQERDAVTPERIAAQRSEGEE